MNNKKSSILFVCVFLALCLSLSVTTLFFGPAEAAAMLRQDGREWRTVS